MLTLALVFILATWSIFGFAEAARVRNGGKPKRQDDYPTSAFFLFFAGWVYSITTADLAKVGRDPERIMADVVKVIANAIIGFLIALLVGETIMSVQNAFNQYLQNSRTEQAAQPQAEKAKEVASTGLASTQGTVR